MLSLVVPGDHWIFVTSRSRKYQLLLTVTWLGTEHVSQGLYFEIYEALQTSFRMSTMMIMTSIIIIIIVIATAIAIVVAILRVTRLSALQSLRPSSSFLRHCAFAVITIIFFIAISKTTRGYCDDCCHCCWKVTAERFKKPVKFQLSGYTLNAFNILVNSCMAEKVRLAVSASGFVE